MYSKNDVALTPPMGWNSYDYYNTTVTEADVRANANYMAKHLRQYGWEYIVIDIQWSDPNAGALVPDVQYVPFTQLCLDGWSRQVPAPVRFPSSDGDAGFKPLADYIHSLGLKFGIHIMRGIPRIAAHNHMPILTPNLTTADKIANPFSVSKWNGDMYGVDYTKRGAQAYYDSVFALYAQWGVDFVKVDDICNTNMYPDNPYSAEKEIEMIALAIERSGRPMVLSLSPGPALIEKAWHLEKYANMWRITDDFWDDWRLLKAMFERCEVWQKHVGGGSWPDCDMLPLGRLGKGFAAERFTSFTPAEQRTMMTLWCIFRSPLMIGADLPQLDEATKALLTNSEVLALLTESHGAEQLRRDEKSCVWKSFAVDSSSLYVALFNLADDAATVSASTAELTLSGNAIWRVRDLWAKQDVESLAASGEKGGISASLPAHGAALFKLSAE
ncbi:MAG: glycoside hydrolase family 27 protein [Treponema sp.]|nr:glycoside hydrolase family 27 protein [Treponema sp.]